MQNTALGKELEAQLMGKYGCTPEEAGTKQLYGALAGAVMRRLEERRAQFVKANPDPKNRKVCYFSMEFLQDRSLRSHLYNLDLLPEAEALLAGMGKKLEDVLDYEPDAGLGNGGLGRLASCYMDGLTSQGYLATGYSILYEFGIFKQEIVDGWQMEFPDNWLEKGSHFLVARPEEAVNVRFGGQVEETWTDDGLATRHTGGELVQAVPYDMLISGKGSQVVNSLRLWQARAAVGFDMAAFSRGEYVKSMESDAKAEAISKVLYPADDHIEGKRLRLKQQYFFVSASLQTIIANELAEYGTLKDLADHIVIHINDTHPALCVPELMRLLMDEQGYTWDEAWETVHKMVAYTNHTVMAEALEKWPCDLFRSLMPRIYSIVEELNRRFCREIYEGFPELRSKINQLAILADGQVKMANMCVLSCYSVNGVSALHSQILAEDLFHDYATVFPGRFTNVTNGIAHRRWLCQSNPLLADYASNLLGHRDFEHDLYALTGLMQYQNDDKVLADLAEIKHQNKIRLAKEIERVCEIPVNPDSIFDIQVKRLHEYKRQLLNGLHIYDLYRQIKFEGKKIHPTTFLFGAKASAGYQMAKEIIRFICALADAINSDPAVRDQLRVVFMPDYRVSMAEIIMPGADVSEQISQAGKEASGTGNMKLMLGGAVTLGTMDGANIEIFESVGPENIFIFGLKTPEVEALARSGYNPGNVLAGNPHLAALLDALERDGVAGKRFDQIVSYLRHRDPYMILQDYSDYARAQRDINAAYQDTRRWRQMSLANTANAGIFSADRAVNDYAEHIWHTTPVK